MHHTYHALYFYYYIISPSNHQALDLGELGTPGVWHWAVWELSAVLNSCVRQGRSQFLKKVCENQGSFRDLEL